ncbi:hypothetical protein DFH09DRAFT_861597, partial [Mycena vulgaris]
WIKNAPSPQIICEQLTGKDSRFRARLIEYLESCHQGEFIHGSQEEVRFRTTVSQGASEYTAPTLTMPEGPPPLCTLPHCDGSCDTCVRLTAWWAKYESEVDDLLLRSNIHDCRHSVRDNRYRTQERRGCLSKHGVCKACFPRDTVEETNVDEDDHLNLKHLEQYMNTVSKILTYFSRSNTDATSMLSGTAIKAVIVYVSEYVSKLGLKSYQAFASVFDVFERNADSLQSGSIQGEEATRKLMRQMINSMSTKMKICSPMADMYLLGNPDHYTSHTYVTFSWRTYVTYVKKFWISQLEVEEQMAEVVPEDMVGVQNTRGDIVSSSVVNDYTLRPAIYDRLNLYEWIQSYQKKEMTSTEKAEFLDVRIKRAKYMADLVTDLGSEEDEEGSDRSFILDDDDGCLEGSSVRPDSPDGSVWEYNDTDDVVVGKQAELDRGVKIVKHPFKKGHGQIDTHIVYCDFSQLDHIIPNFIGGAIPRSDCSDREYYCMSKLS